MVLLKINTNKHINKNIHTEIGFGAEKKTKIMWNKWKYSLKKIVIKNYLQMVSPSFDFPYVWVYPVVIRMSMVDSHQHFDTHHHLLAILLALMVVFVVVDSRAYMVVLLLDLESIAIINNEEIDNAVSINKE